MTHFNFVKSYFYQRLMMDAMLNIVQKFPKEIGRNFQRNSSHGLMHCQIFVGQINAGKYFGNNLYRFFRILFQFRISLSFLYLHFKKNNNNLLRSVYEARTLLASVRETECVHSAPRSTKVF